VPRDRGGSFEPQLIAKGQTRFDGFDDKILSLYAPQSAAGSIFRRSASGVVMLGGATGWRRRGQDHIATGNARLERFDERLPSAFPMATVLKDVA
jgi:hypothetical protein